MKVKLMGKLLKFAQYYNSDHDSLHPKTEEWEVQDILLHLCHVEGCLLQEDVDHLQEDPDLHQEDALQLEDDEIGQEAALLNQDRMLVLINFYLLNCQ